MAAKQAWVWDAETGVRHMLDVQDGTLELCLTPAEAKFIVFEKDRGGQMLPAPALPQCEPHCPQRHLGCQSHAPCG
ncbi:MAG: hypothetical protein ACLUQ6_12310 [Alistipes onderdonkii]